MTKIFSIGKVVKMTKIWGPGHGFERVQTGPPAQRQLVGGLAATSSQDPQKGSKMVKIRSNSGPSRSLQGPPGQRAKIGTFWREAKRVAQEAQNGSKIGSKWHFPVLLMAKWSKIDFFNRKMAKIDIFNRKMVQNDQNLRFWAWV